MKTEPNTPEDDNSVDNIENDKKYKDFVVGIGASAGGLEALERFFTHCPAKSGCAYVVVQHLSPDHKSMMLDLLGRYTKMKVVMVKDGMEIKPDTVFLIPAAKIMRIHGNKFELTPKVPHTFTLPIDIFFTSLAEAFGRYVIGVVLSGTGSDGTRGAVAINAAGGFLMAQDPKSAKFDGMPTSVIGTGLVDATLPPEELPHRLLAYINNKPPSANITEVSHNNKVPLTEEDAYDGIMELLLQASGIDFHDYKMATILRRIERRMQVRHFSKIDLYYKLIQQEREELATLRRELLIPVTNFFRDPDSFSSLNQEVIKKIVAESVTGSNIRVWIAGTSTGEEAYTIGMLFMEAFEQERRWPNLKIFATDVSQDSIDIASAGSYSEAAATEITEERLQRFFTQVGNSYEVKSELRQLIVFAKHNLLSDPPFTHMDMVSCRNTLIYFTQQAQDKAFQRLQFAVKPEGFLFLGSSESIANRELGFSSTSAKHKIFKRTSQVFSYSSDVSKGAFTGYRTPIAPTRTRLKDRIANDSLTLDSAISALIEQYTPPSMLVNNHNEVIHLFGKVQPYVQAREGVASLLINRLLPDRLKPVASALMFKASKDSKRIVSDLISIEFGESDKRRVRLSVTPISKHDDESLLLLSFEEHPETTTDVQLEAVNVDEETAERIEVLERELSATRESLQSTIEELETSNEELQATNEELMASNEELQSSNEELQSLNEELNTVNAEYQEKVSIMNRINADLDSMSKAVGVPTVFIDNEMNLTRFTPDAVGLFKLRDSDIGRPLDEIANIIKYPTIMEDLKKTMLTGHMIQKEITAQDNSLYLMRILPYQYSNNPQGAVATFVDITAFRDQQRLQCILDALPEHIAVLEFDGNITMVNKAWTRFARANGDADLTLSGPGTNYLEVCNTTTGLENTDAKRAYMGIKSVLEGSETFFTMQYPCHSKTEKRWFVMNVAPILSNEYAVVVSHINISAWYAEQVDKSSSD